jgi:hypothetical protein
MKFRFICASIVPVYAWFGACLMLFWDYSILVLFLGLILGRTWS